ncbi:MAG: hypothetical protein H6Q75_1306 [Firmicutes bacterium]|nr:hypothetical protein [Bacillota bacterium]
MIEMLIFDLTPIKPISKFVKNPNVELRSADQPAQISKLQEALNMNYSKNENILQIIEEALSGVDIASETKYNVR